MRGVGWDEGIAVHIRRLSVPVAEAPMGRGPRPAPGRGRPARQLGVSSPSPPHSESARLPRQTPQPPKED